MGELVAVGGATEWAGAMSGKLVLVRSDLGDGGWSLHPPGTTDDTIRDGGGIILAAGIADCDPTGAWDAPDARDYATAWARWAEISHSARGGLPVAGEGNRACAGR